MGGEAVIESGVPSLGLSSHTMPSALYSKKPLSIFSTPDLVLPDSRTLRNEAVLYRLPHLMYPITETQNKGSHITH